jgi:predicted tellurium resistance membrane protein TerC
MQDLIEQLLGFAYEILALAFQRVATGITLVVALVLYGFVGVKLLSDGWDALHLPVVALAAVLAAVLSVMLIIMFWFESTFKEFEGE